MKVSSDNGPVRGRFAPTPSGPLHAGSLLAALASWLDVRTREGIWLVRFDDLDIARCPPGQAGVILRQLEAHGLEWDGVPIHESQFHDRYAQALEKLRTAGLLYRCDCTRAVLHRSEHHGPDGPVYDGRCRNRPPGSTGPRSALRLRAGSGKLHFDDGIQGALSRDIETEIGDFIVCRSDGIYGYQLACAVDEAELHITHVVRGADLIGSTFRQRIVQHALGLAPPRYAHVPLLLDADGNKLSKQNHASTLDASFPGRNLYTALGRLNQRPEPWLAREPPATILDWALAHWQPHRIPCSATL